MSAPPTYRRAQTHHISGALHTPGRKSTAPAGLDWLEYIRHVWSAMLAGLTSDLRTL